MTCTITEGKEMKIRLRQCDPDDDGAMYVSAPMDEGGVHVKLQFQVVFSPFKMASGDIGFYQLETVEWVDVPLVLGSVL